MKDDNRRRPPRKYNDREERRSQENAVEENENQLEGRNALTEALRSGRTIDKVFVASGETDRALQKLAADAKAAGAVVVPVDRRKLDMMSITRSHQGVIALAAARAYFSIDDILETAAERGECPLIVICDELTDPHNLGAIIRSAECVGAHGVIVPERRSVGLTPAAVKSSAGAVEHMKVARVTNLTRTIDELKKQNVWTYAVTMNGQDYMKTDFRGGVALVIGAEGEGISRLTLEHCDQRVSLPMKGAIDSLNASVAAGVMMYRVLASRK